MALNPLQQSAAARSASGCASPPQCPAPLLGPHRISILDPIIDPTRQSNRTTLVRKVEEVLSEAPRHCLDAASRRRSRTPSEQAADDGGKGTQTGTQTPVGVEGNSTSSVDPLHLLPQPIESTRRSNRKAPAPVQTAAAAGPPNPYHHPATPPTPPPSTTTALLPKPFEVSRRSNRPVARPLVPNRAEEAPKSNLARGRPDTDAESDALLLPQPVSSARYVSSNRITKPGARHLRRSSTVQPPGAPGVYYFVPETGVSNAATATTSSPTTTTTTTVSTTTTTTTTTNAYSSTFPQKRRWSRPKDDHVSHLHEPVDSAPPSPSGSPAGSRSSSPVMWSIDSLVEGKVPLSRRESGGDAASGERGYQSASALMRGQLQQRRQKSVPRPTTAAAAAPKSKLSHETKFINVSGKERRDSESGVSAAAAAAAAAFKKREAEEEETRKKKKEEESKKAAAAPAVAALDILSPPPLQRKPIPNIHHRQYDDFPIFASPTKEPFLPKAERVPTRDLMGGIPMDKAPTTYKDQNHNHNQYNNNNNNTNHQLPTPPDSTTTPLKTQYNQQQQTLLQQNDNNATAAAVLSFGKLKVPLVGYYYPTTSLSPSLQHTAINPGYRGGLFTPKPSPGITVASLPPGSSSRKSNPSAVPTRPEDVTDEFVEEVWRYLSLEHESVARKYDWELGEYTGRRVCVGGEGEGEGDGGEVGAGARRRKARFDALRDFFWDGILV
ncbi:hypothetical protein DFH27DRAFT_522897 [Peziza echinospora]|nr:hypothetical protein DFH27DRAFT_522897 [Peziza echinospora]